MSTTNKIFCCVFVLLLSSLGVRSQSNDQKMHELVEAYAGMYKFNGTVLVASKGRVVFSKGYGFKNVKDSALNDVNTIYQLGSITKQFTATVILKLAEQKKLKVSDKLTKYFPGYPGGDSITIRHLLTHTSGIYNYTESQQFMRSEAVKPATKEKNACPFQG
jgi:CubicO group peptidase (beta-lactamase class C family)